MTKNHWRCPNCLKELEAEEQPTKCIFCKKNFEPNSEWNPVSISKENSPSKGGFFLFRLIIGAIVWVVIAAMALMSAIPYGGGDKDIFLAFVIATIVIPIFVFLQF